MNLDTHEIIKLIEGPQQPNRQGYDGLTIPQIMARHSVPGLSVAVIKDFQLHWAKGYGQADALAGTNVSTETLFQAASISKPVNVMAVLKAVQEGVFSLDDDVNSLLKSFRLPDNPYSNIPITARMLASHTSGLGDGFGFPGYEPGKPLPTIADIITGHSLSNVAKPEFSRTPFEAFKYSGAGSVILQQLLIDIMGEIYPEILQKSVLGPLKMCDSYFEQPLDSARDLNAARAHGSSGEALDVKWRVYPELAAAGLWTTPTDLAKFVIEVQKSILGTSNTVLDQAHAQSMVNPVGVGDYGLGFRILKEGQGWFFEHGGGNWGFRCRLFAHKLKGYGFVMMTNANQGTAVVSAVKERIETLYNWDSIAKPAI
ncbi:serine hydrolase domain-containing protein [Gilvimarinus sp. SDUM040013]|uniref:Serine hydrolase domain-containing protein n=1 Tax=Gilvimarinus gilvus TaxID=3058038 RepID=A0ABU4S4K3_9GAMM|nr:serine hydrolase domain-containing protein [Gilvimarinus sp. SDUM040013]MDO3387503.1 serine hydrolase domain-containing protein [Gilvimarinus sp. SDUM040013]MDX6851351.1 serine hydrolase domain-containing protein [Gilvimarinus sp. SDUM040013]